MAEPTSGARETTPSRDYSPGEFVPLAPRDETARTRRFHRGETSPLAIRWFGITALWGHLRHLTAVTAASNQLDLRDWMRPEEADALLDRVARVLGAPLGGHNVAERLGREVWIDFVADTGDDHDVSSAVGRLLFAGYALAGDEPLLLPRGDLLVCGGDTAYPAATPGELERRLLGPWNGALSSEPEGEPHRVLLGIPGNHDWYDGLDGFGRLFRRSALQDLPEPETGERAATRDPFGGRLDGALLRHLHLDEIGESLRLAGEAFESLTAILLGREVRRANRLALAGYVAVQEASYWALALAPGLDLWGVDRQLRSTDFRQRLFFAKRRAVAQSHKVLLVASDPALAYGEPNEPGEKILEACRLSLAANRVFYLTGDVHHYERQKVGDSLHVIAGGGGAFLHGSRIAPGEGSIPPERVYPDRKTSLGLALGMPVRLALGTAGFIPHLLFGLLAAVEAAAMRRGPVSGMLAVISMTLLATVSLGATVRARIQRPAATWALVIPFGLVLGMAPLVLRVALFGFLPQLGVAPAVVAHAFLGSFVLGVFLLVLALTGVEHHQVFAALGHPGFRHFVRLCVHPSGRVEGFVIGKDDILGKGPPVLVDRFGWD